MGTGSTVSSFYFCHVATLGLGKQLSTYREATTTHFTLQRAFCSMTLTGMRACGCSQPAHGRVGEDGEPGPHHSRHLRLGGLRWQGVRCARDSQNDKNVHADVRSAHVRKGWTRLRPLVSYAGVVWQAAHFCLPCFLAGTGFALWPRQVRACGGAAKRTSAQDSWQHTCRLRTRPCACTSLVCHTMETWMGEQSAIRRSPARPCCFWVRAQHKHPSGAQNPPGAARQCRRAPGCISARGLP